MSADILLGTNCDQCRSTVQCCFMSTETVRLIRTESTGQSPWLSHSSRTLPAWKCCWSLLCSAIFRSWTDSLHSLSNYPFSFKLSFHLPKWTGDNVFICAAYDKWYQVLHTHEINTSYFSQEAVSVWHQKHVFKFCRRWSISGLRHSLMADCLYRPDVGDVNVKLVVTAAFGAVPFLCLCLPMVPVTQQPFLAESTYNNKNKGNL